MNHDPSMDPELSGTDSAEATTAGAGETPSDVSAAPAMQSAHSPRWSRIRRATMSVLVALVLHHSWSHHGHPKPDQPSPCYAVVCIVAD